MLEKQEEQIRQEVISLIKKFDVIFERPLKEELRPPSRRARGPKYLGPDFTPEIEALRELFKLPKPAAHPREYYPKDYCKTCDGTGKVFGGEGIADDHTRMNMRTWVIAVKDLDGGAKKLAELFRLTPDNAAQVISSAPFELPKVRFVGHNPWSRKTYHQEYGNGPYLVILDEDQLSQFFELRKLRQDHRLPRERKWKDICIDCRGTGGRGLPVASLGWDESGNCISAKDWKPEDEPT